MPHLNVKPHITRLAMKRAFTLVELLIVIGIIGTLMATLIHYAWGGTEAARAAQCKANLKNLANAVGNAVAADTTYHRYPLAGSIEHVNFGGFDSGNAGSNRTYSEQKGWISWNSNGAYKNNPKNHVANQGWFTSTYNNDRETREYCLTNGALWSVISASAETYRCPNHTRVMKEANPNWSYVMNAWFGWDETMGQGTRQFLGRTADGMRADKRLLFAELQWTDYTGEKPEANASSGTRCDCTLQYKGCGGKAEPEVIGFNHKSGRDVVAHVVYADGHVDEIAWRDGQDLQELTKWLCEAKDVAFDSASGKYQEMK